MTDVSNRPPVREPSEWAIGWIYFASVMMVLLGIFHAIAGLIAIFDDTFYVTTRKYVFQFDATQWGWIHLILGILVAAAGLAVLRGNVLARTVGVLIAAVCAIAGFAWMPYYPGWAIIVIVLAVSVIWALTVHGRDAENNY